MGPASWVAAQILPYYRGQEETANVELTALEDAIGRDSPYAEFRNAVCGADFQKSLE